MVKDGIISCIRIDRPIVLMKRRPTPTYNCAKPMSLKKFYVSYAAISAFLLWFLATV
jgi:hypothetical protein